MHQGKIWEAGASSEIFAAPKTAELRGFLSAGRH
jgi:ABC-type histidine transport system ATPase subunit